MRLTLQTETKFTHFTIVDIIIYVKNLNKKQRYDEYHISTYFFAITISEFLIIIAKISFPLSFQLLIFIVLVQIPLIFVHDGHN